MCVLYTHYNPFHTCFPNYFSWSELKDVENMICVSIIISRIIRCIRVWNSGVSQLSVALYFFFWASAAQNENFNNANALPAAASNSCQLLACCMQPKIWLALCLQLWYWPCSIAHLPSSISHVQCGTNVILLFLVIMLIINKMMMMIIIYIIGLSFSVFSYFSVLAGSTTMANRSTTIAELIELCLHYGTGQPYWHPSVYSFSTSL